MSRLKRTIFYERHVALGAKMVDFSGWEMPIFHPTGIVEEHDEEGFAAAGALRTGVSEMTRFGMEEEDFGGLAALIHDVVMKNSHVADQVKALRERFLELKFCFRGEQYADALQKLEELL